MSVTVMAAPRTVAAAPFRARGERSGHRWAWGMIDGGTVRRTALVRVQWVEGRDGPLLRTGTSDLMLATFCICEVCGTVRADVEHPEGGPTLHAYGVDAEGLVAGSGAPSCGVQIPRRGEEGASS
jgi:hypothetical protein